MGTGFNQIVQISGGPGATSVQTVDYNPATHTLSIISANGTIVPVILKDSHVESVALNGNMMEFSIGDQSHGLADTVVSVDVTAFKNYAFATQTETDNGNLADVMLSPMTLKQWLTNVVIATDATPANMDRLVPLAADGKIDPKWLHQIAITDTHVVVDLAALDLLSAAGTVQKGDVGVVTSANESYIFNGTSWQKLLTPTDSVLSVNGHTGAVILTTDDVTETSLNMYLKAGMLDGDILTWDAAHGKWMPHQEVCCEVGGKAFHPDAEYEAGDIVNNAGHVYTRIAAGHESIFDDTKWQIVDATGKLHSDTSTYSVGDVVTYGGVLYINTAKISTAKPFSSADWSPVTGGGGVVTPVVPERGGVIYDVAAQYLGGDIVSHLGVPYVATGPIQGTTPAPGVTGWKEVSSVERGGTVWGSGTQYKKNDVVSMTGTDKLYIAMRDNQGSTPLAGTDWFELHSIRYNVGEFAPATGTELPDTTGETSGAVWYVQGLSSAGFTMPNGTNVQNNDKIIWYGLDSSNNDIWLYEPFPMIHGEMGGLPFGSSNDYLAGMLVTNNGKTYMSLVDIPNGGNAPTAGSIDWKEVGVDGKPNVTYDTNSTYAIGDIVGVGSDLYMANTGVNVGNTPPSASWTLMTEQADVRGGIAWDALTTYKQDDIVALGQNIFIANSVSTNKTPGIAAEWTALSLVEKGGLLYNASVLYSVGDIVSNNGSVFTAVIPVPANTPPPNTTYWATPTVAELGGRVWGSGISYITGDIVADNLDGEVYVALSPGVGAQPSLTLSKWKRVGSQPAVAGKAFDPLASYDVGDLVTYTDATGTYIYRATAANSGAFVPAEWEIANAEEIGGIRYNSTTNYMKGDTVADSAYIPVRVWISLEDNNSNNPLILGSHWQELDTIFYTVGMYTPAAGSEYPDTTGEHIGGIWYVNGLGDDPVTGFENTYTIAAGPLAGINVKDQDKIIWVDGAQGSELWLDSPYPMIHAEQGGLLYSSGRGYKIGDIVSLNTDMYVSLTGDAATPNTGNQPDTDIVNWKLGGGVPVAPEQGGIAFDSTITYFPGDMVGIVDATLPAPFNAEMRVWVCQTGVGPSAWTGIANWSDTANGGTY